MLSHEIAEKLESVFGPYIGADQVSMLPKSVEPADDLIDSLAIHFYQMQESVKNIAIGKEANSMIPLSRHLAATHGVVSRFSSRKVFVALDRMIELIRNLSALDGDHSYVITSLADSLEGFSDVYDSYLTSPKPEKAYALIESANAVNLELRTVLSTLRVIYHEFNGSFENSDPDDADKLATFSVFLPFRDDFSHFLQRLAAIRQLYQEACGLLGVSPDVSPLRIGKVESGSLWVKLFGERKAVNLMVRFVEEGASYIYRKFTIEGQISSIPRKVESLDRVIRLRESLREIGIDINGIDDQIAKSAVVIAKNLNVLLERQSSVKVNGRITSISDEMLKAEIESHPWPQLEHIDAQEVDERKSETKQS